jgi:hypothetical protein
MSCALEAAAAVIDLGLASAQHTIQGYYHMLELCFIYSDMKHSSSIFKDWSAMLGTLAQSAFSCLVFFSYTKFCCLEVKYHFERALQT